jgi:hypothetical protein
MTDQPGLNVEVSLVLHQTVDDIRVLKRVVSLLLGQL